MITIYLMSQQANQQRPEDTLDFKKTMVEWERQLGTSSMSAKMQEAWRANYGGLTTHSTTIGPGHFLVSVHDPMTKTRHFLGALNKVGTTIDISEVIGSPVTNVLDGDTRDLLTYMQSTESGQAVLRVREEAKPLGCFFSWAVANSTRVTLTANTVGLIKLYRLFGFEMDPSGANMTLPLNRLERFDGLKRYLEGLKKKSVGWSDEISGKIGDEYENRTRNSGQIVEALRTPQGVDEFLGIVLKAFDDAKFAVVNKTMTLTVEGSGQLRETYKELVHWKGSHI